MWAIMDAWGDLNGRVMVDGVGAGRMRSECVGKCLELSEPGLIQPCV